jgi:hypothetical protein
VNRNTGFKLISLIVAGICVSVSGCRPSLDDLTVWKAEVRSPDGIWIASARTIQNGGFGSAHIDTIVYLMQNNASQPPKDVLAFSCLGPVPRPYVLDNVANSGGTIDLTMKWVTPSHLDVTYDSHPDLYFQVLKYGGINISVQDLSNGPTRGKDSK